MALVKPGPEDESMPPLALLWFATLHEIQHQQHLVRDLLVAGSLFVVFGESNSGKTFWIIDLCIRIAAGKPWRGRVTSRGLVVYVAGEGAASVRMRVAAYRIANPDIGAGLPFAILPRAVDFLSINDVTTLIETIRAAESECGEKVALVVVDTFARAIPGGNENDAQDVGIAVATADRIRVELGCCVGFVHHAGKDPSKGARGSSALRAACDTEILIEGQQGPRTATVTKQRDLFADKPMPFELVPVNVGRHPDDDSDITSCVVKQADAEEAPASANVVQLRGKAQRQLIAALRARSSNPDTPPWTLVDLRQIGRELGMSKSTARSVVDAIVTTPYMRATLGGYRFTDGRVEG